MPVTRVAGLTRRTGLAALVAAALPCCAPRAPTPAARAPSVAAWSPGQPWPTIVRREGESCGGYPAPGAPIETCAAGSTCDYGSAPAVDAPGVCRTAR